ncbi:unnamed protein product [Chrysoparadoxa australica]
MASYVDNEGAAPEGGSTYNKARGGGYGLDAELALKREALYDHNAEREAIDWIEAVTGEQLDGDFFQGLKSGVLLLKLMNTIKPSLKLKVHRSKIPYMQMENISTFLIACRKLGVAEHSLFETVDLYEGKDLGLVHKCLFVLGGVVQREVPEFQGPQFGARAAAPNKREWTEEQAAQARLDSSITRLSKGSSETMDRQEVVRTGITFGSEYAGEQHPSAVVPMSAAGSYGIIERVETVDTGIMMGAKLAGSPTATETVSMMASGSQGIMERRQIIDKSITMGADLAGEPVADANMPKIGAGSQGIMQRTSSSAAMHGITKGAEILGSPAPSATMGIMSMGSRGTMEQGHLATTDRGICTGADLSGPPASSKADEGRRLGDLSAALGEVSIDPAAVGNAGA